MAHNPINHPARSTWRALGGLIGLYLVVFGAIGAAATAGDGFFAQDTERVLGQGTNLANSVLSILVGGVVLISVLIGRNVDVAVNKILAYALMVIGLGSLAVIRTDANYLAHSVTTTIVFMSLGMVLLLSSMYGKVGTDDEHEAWQRARLEF